jgi:ESS family glutamate:Na+ symporter
VLAIPIILSVNLPAFSYTRNRPELFWLAVGISAVYLVGAFIAYMILSGKRSFANRRKLFHTDEEVS